MITGVFTVKRLLSAFLALVFAGTCLGQAKSEAAGFRHRALLVGVSEYPALSGKDLKGPRQDVLRMRDELLRRGVPKESVVVLTEGPDPRMLPTRRRIFEELTHLAQTARPGDYVTIMMTGHGSRSPVPAGSPFTAEEPDGLFEIFLPRDTSAWDDRADGGQGDVVNAIKDHEIRAQVDAMVARGAFVWAIFDACHSATLVRAGDVTLRQVEPSDLRIPQNRLDDAQRQAVQASKSRPGVGSGLATPGLGRAVYFYAAQASEKAPEMPLPRGTPGSPVHGLFSYSVLRALEAGLPMTYRQLQQHVLLQYRANFEARSVTPVFSGTGLDTPVLGDPAPMARQWPLGRNTQDSKTPPAVEIKAGPLSEVHPGSLFALLRTAIDPTNQALGYAVVEASTGPDTSRLRAAGASGTVLDRAALPEGATVARLVRAAPDFGLNVAVDLSRCTAPCPFETPLQGLKASAVPGVAVRWAGPGQGADLLLRAVGRRLWMLPAGQDPLQDCSTRAAAAKARCEREVERSFPYIDAHAAAAPPAVRQALESALHAAARAQNLLRIAGQQVAVDSGARVAVAAPSSATSPGGPTLAQVRQGTALRVSIRNDPAPGLPRRPLDITVLFIDSKFGIGLMYPVDGEVNRLQAGDKPIEFEMKMDDSESATLGPEHLVVIAVQAEQHTAPANYSFLVQSPLEFDIIKRGSGTKTVADDPVMDFLSDAAFATRSASRNTPPALLGVHVTSFKVVP